MPKGQNTMPAQWRIVDTKAPLRGVEDFLEDVVEVVIEVAVMATTEEMVITITTNVTGIDPDLIPGLDLDQDQDRGLDLVAVDLVLEVVVVPDLAVDHAVLAADHHGHDPDQDQPPDREGPDQGRDLIAPDRGPAGRNPNRKNRCRCRNLPPSTWLPL